MANVEDILKKLNKKKSEEDKHIGIVGDRVIERTFVSTGSPYLDYLTGGGFTCGAYNQIIADGGTGKSSIALLACKSVMTQRTKKDPSKNKKAVYYDGEFTMDDSYFNRMGVDKHSLVYETGRNLEDMLDFVEAMSTADDVGIIVIDSLSIFTASSVEAKSAGELHMGTEAACYTRRIPIIEGNCAKRGIVLLGLTSYKLNPGAAKGADPRSLPRGRWQLTMANTMLDISKRDSITDSDGKPIGHEVRVRVKKSKTNSYNPKKYFDLNFYYDGGFNATEQFIDLFLANGIIEQGGAYYTIYDADGVEQKFQGKAKLTEFIKSNDDVLAFNKTRLDEVFSVDRAASGEMEFDEEIEEFKKTVNKSTKVEVT